MTLPSTPLDANSPEGKALLSGLQGNILEGHGREHVAFVFGEASPNVLAGLARDLLPGGRMGCLRSARYGGGGGGLFASLGLSERGARALERTLSLTGAPISSHLATTPPTNLTCDAMILLASDDPGAMTTAVSQLRALWGTTTFVEQGAVLGSDGTPREPFGFVDGVSQPLFLNRQWQANAPKYSDAYSPALMSYAAGSPAPAGAPPTSYNPWADLDLVLVPDPLVAPGSEPAYGSFVVYRKLRQDVALFHETYPDRYPTPPNRVSATTAVGRFPDGAALEQSDRPDSPARNNFLYGPNPRTPEHAHIRAANPRTPAERGNRIVRRGVPYEKDGEKGLHFVSYQADLARQFTRMWGHVQGDAIMKYVEHKRGASFFVPSIVYLQQLAATA